MEDSGSDALLDEPSPAQLANELVFAAQRERDAGGLSDARVREYSAQLEGLLARVPAASAGVIRICFADATARGESSLQRVGS